MLDSLGSDFAELREPMREQRRTRARRLRAARRASRWLLLAGWIVLPLLPLLGIGLSMLLGLGVS